MITLELKEAIAGCERIQRRLAQITNIIDHAGDLMEHWERLMEEGNRRGVLNGTDKAGNAMAPVFYRPSRAQQRAIYAGVAKPVKLTVSQRLGQQPRKMRGEFYGIGSHQSGVNNNLTSSEYRKLDGPPLAPRRQFSRVITNFKATSFQPEEHGYWMVVGSWREVVSAKKVHFLPFHFNGDGNLPVRDLRGVRPDDIRKMRASILPWAKLTIRALWQETE